MNRVLNLLGYLLLIVQSTGSADAGDGKGTLDVEFNRDIRPILSDTCFHCHGPDKAKRKADLRLDREEDGAKVIVAGQPSESELFKRITSADESEHMPPRKSDRKLTQDQIETVRRWIEAGAKWEPHWSFIPPKRSPLPEVRDGRWPRNPIDYFILARLEKEGFAPSVEAAKTTLIRRASLDLTGLPPTPEQVDAFLADESADAYERVVDGLLASPRYGERMALDWLDAARYADTNGYQNDPTRTMWPWRDWAINAFNDNMPFDQFTIEQLAGDLLPNATLSQKMATGFQRNHALNGEGGRIPEESRVDYVVDRVETTAAVWLGLTLGCARCHDHKFDPVTQKEFYQIFAYYNNVPETGSSVEAYSGHAAPVLQMPTAEQTEQMAQLTAELTVFDEQIAAAASQIQYTTEDQERAVLGSLLTFCGGNLLNLPEHGLVLTTEQQQLLQQAAACREKLRVLKKSILEVMVMEERHQPRDTFVLIRGGYNSYGEKVEPGTPGCLSSMTKEKPTDRLGLARWLVDPNNPLPARVIVNRYWQQCFGTGLVKTVDDFGVQGEPPSHAELLDWLATEFVHGGWNVKSLLKLIVTSATYRQSSSATEDAKERDPGNRLLSHGSRFRLPSQIIRDQALAISGLLVEKVGGRPVKPYQPPGIWEEMSFGKIKYEQDKGADLYRRSLYTFWRRTVGPPDLFDTSSRQICMVRQVRTNTPLQALILLNDVTYVEAARVFAERILSQGGNNVEERIDFAFRLATARQPTEKERRVLVQSWYRLFSEYQADEAAALKVITAGESPRNPNLDPLETAAYMGLASLILNLDEVITKE